MTFSKYVFQFHKFTKEFLLYMQWPLRNFYTFHHLVDFYRNTISEWAFGMGSGFQVWKLHLKNSLWGNKSCLLGPTYSPWEASFSSCGLIFGGEEISISETRPMPSYNLGTNSKALHIYWLLKLTSR